jgi:hypothetical protein
MVHEEVFATLVRGDKAAALLAIEPVDRSLGHVLEAAFISLGFVEKERFLSLPGGQGYDR